MVNLSKIIYDDRHAVNMLKPVVTEMNKNVQKIKSSFSIPTSEVTMHIDGLKPYDSTSVFEVIKHCLAHLAWLERSLYEYRALSKETNQDFYSSFNRTQNLEKKLNLLLHLDRANRRSTPNAGGTIRPNSVF